MKKFGELLILYLGLDSSNNDETIVYSINKIVDGISDTDKLFKQEKLAVDDMIIDLKNILRLYFKVEWYRSIGKIEDDDVNNK